MTKLAGAVVLSAGPVGLSACAPLPTSSAPVQASRSQPCAKISWRDLGPARDINTAIINERDARPIRTAYGPGTRAPAPDSGERAEPDQPLRSEGSIGLAVEMRRESEKAYAQAVEHWLQAHLTVEVRRCPS